MERIKGISVEKLNFDMEFVGILLFQEFPVTTIYSDNKNPIVKEWVDCDDNLDRYIIYKTSKLNLKLFIEAKINHLKLFHTATDSLVYIIDENNIGIQSIKITSTSLIPNDYLPTEQSFFSNEDGVETKKIIEYFKLDNLEIIKEKYIDRVKYISKKEHSDIFNLHIKSGKGVYFGSIETKILGKALLSFESLYKETVLDYFLGTNRGNLKINKKVKDDKIELTKTVVFEKEAASFSVFLKPKYSSQFLMFEEKTEFQKIMENMYELFNISENERELKEKYSKYSSFVYKSYKDFLKTIIQNETKLELNWVSFHNVESYSKLFTLKVADKILQLIENINFEDINKFEVKGKFRAINCNTGFFRFISLYNEEYKGHFDKLLMEYIVLLNFKDLYNITIERKIKKEIGDKEEKIQDTILAYYEIKDDV